ncbi:Na+/H+ antiporter subunit E [Desulfonatronum lacustre]|uniref:Na+/H+ antiporter subunit E n=1 Tax=Desulfonatronum lacustre TaxID=66849 RepID=UPI000A0429B2|nr:Na+/H+ antiporter subunit E [Desulfonatronum lacustre]SMP65915.1 multicomponent Na+:H+ antiporter subunit E [Desulfonatronum zhilinae]
MAESRIESRDNSSESARSPEWSLPRPGGILARILGFSLLWWILTEGGSLLSILGLLGVGLAVLASFRLLPPRSWPLRPLAVVRFLPYFLWQSLLGGLDVASRAMRLRVDLTPTVITHVFAQESESVRVLFLWVVSLLPGTAAVDLQGDKARIHVLDQRLADSATLRELERRIAGMFQGGGYVG